MDKEILEFIRNNKIASLSCCADNKPHCFNCFYLYWPEEECIIFKSGEQTEHMRIMLENPLVAGTILPGEVSYLKIIGMQLEGVVNHDSDLHARAVKLYYIHNPMAMAMPGKIWVIQLTKLKYSSTIAGIKKKLEWVR